MNPHCFPLKMHSPCDCTKKQFHRFTRNIYHKSAGLAHMLHMHCMAIHRQVSGGWAVHQGNNFIALNLSSQCYLLGEQQVLLLGVGGVVLRCCLFTAVVTLWRVCVRLHKHACMCACITLHCAALCCIALHCSTLPFLTLPTLPCIKLHYVTLHHTHYTKHH